MKNHRFLWTAGVVFCTIFLSAAEKDAKPLSFVAENIRPVRIWENHPVPFSVPEDAGRKEYLVKRHLGKTRRITNIAVPEIYPFFAEGKGPHPAVVVAPGGGYGYLGWDGAITVCRWLQRNGFTAFLLKYRCPRRRPAARADAARSIRLIRFRAAEFNIDPRRVGMIGFSAGAHLTAAVSASPEEPYPGSDAADKLDWRPNAAALIYPAFLLEKKKDFTLSKEFLIDKNTPSSLLIQTGDDPINVDNSIVWYRALQKAGIPCEMHIWAKGGHGYGLRKGNLPVSDWPEAALKWFRRMH